MTPATHTTVTAELTAVRGELVRVDAKCSTLAGLCGAGMAFLVSALAGRGAHGLAWWCCWGAALLLAGAVLVLLAVLRPHLGKTGFRLYARQTTPTGLNDLFTGDQAADPALADLWVLSRLTNRKYRGLRTAVDLAAAAITLIGLALLACAGVTA